MRGIIDKAIGIDAVTGLGLPSEPASTGALAIAAELEEDIVFGRLAPGTALREERLLERFGGSRHAVRAALSVLEGKKIIVRPQNRGASVRTMTATEVRELHEVREMLQRQAALRIRLPVTDSDFSMLAAIEQEYEGCVAAGDLRGMHDANDRFHDALFALCGNQHLQALIRQLLHLSYIVRIRTLADADDRAKAQGEHRLMLGLLKGTDGWALAEVCVAHIRPRRDAYLGFLAERDKPRGKPRGE